MELFNIFSGLLVLAAIFSWINQRYMKFPASISIMLLGVAASLIVQVAGAYSPSIEYQVISYISRIDFSEVVLNFMLCFLLFAGALHTDLDRLAKARWQILTFATVGVLLTALLLGLSLYYFLGLAGFELDLIHCLLFGTLISPTDPIAVMGILKKAKLPERLEVKFTGESLFNDAVAVIVFIIFFQIIRKGPEDISSFFVFKLILREVGGGILLGLLLGYFGTYLIKTIDHYQTEVLITLALVTGGYAYASWMHFSGPLSMVIAGLFIGNRSKVNAMSDLTLDYTQKFWEMIDEILNAALFLLIGLELIIIKFSLPFVLTGIFASFLLIGVRYISLYLPSFLFGFRKTFAPHTILILTWGGLRGGISIALALSLPVTNGKELIVAMTYVVVLFSIGIQGMTIGPLINNLQKRLKKP